jgi:hypothetical protein
MERYLANPVKVDVEVEGSPDRGHRFEGEDLPGGTDPTGGEQGEESGVCTNIYDRITGIDE